MVVWYKITPQDDDTHVDEWMFDYILDENGPVVEGPSEEFFGLERRFDEDDVDLLEDAGYRVEEVDGPPAPEKITLQEQEEDFSDPSVKKADKREGPLQFALALLAIPGILVLVWAVVWMVYPTIFEWFKLMNMK